MFKALVLLSCIAMLAGISVAQSSDQINVMPLPEKYQLGSGQMPVDGTFSVAIEGAKNARIQSAVDRFVSQLSKETGIPLLSAKNVTGSAKLIITAEHSAKDVLEFGEDESYSLDVTPTQAKLHAANDLGVIHGLQTFLQLVQPGPKSFVVPVISIQDQPRFPWRGLMLDVSRHFMPIEVLKRNLNGMEAAKLNVLHLHLSDDQGFRFESKKFPKLTEKGSNGQFYTQNELRELIQYASDRGIRVVPEFDIPGHTTALLAAYPELGSAATSYEVSQTFGVHDAALDPTRKETYKFLDELIGEVTNVFPEQFFHIGGDEVNGKEWDANPKIQAFMKSHNLKNNGELQAYFNKQVFEIIKKHKRTMIGWDEILNPDLPKTIVIQSWRGQKSLADAAKLGYRGLLSSGYYLDLMWPAERHYGVEPVDPTANLSQEEQARIIGGEACMWSEYANEMNLDLKVWPRAAAVAERLWSPVAVRDTESMYARMYLFGTRLNWYGLTQNDRYPDMLRRIAGGNDTSSLRVLADVVEPVKDYTREGLNQANPDTTVTALNRLVDVVPPESEMARQFRLQALALVANPDNAQLRARIRAELTVWRNNDAMFQQRAEGNALMSEVAPLSTNLRILADAGLQALDYLQKGDPAPADWAAQQSRMISDLDKPEADLLLTIIPGIQNLVDAAAHTSVPSAK